MNCVVIDVICLTEKWHDSDSVVLNRLQVESYQVVDCPLLGQLTADNLSTHHDGVAAVAETVSVVTPLAVLSRTTFKVMCVRIVLCSFNAVIVVIYRPGLAAILQLFIF